MSLRGFIPSRRRLLIAVLAVVVGAAVWTSNRLIHDSDRVGLQHARAARDALAPFAAEEVAVFAYSATADEHDEREQLAAIRSARREEQRVLAALRRQWGHDAGTLAAIAVVSRRASAVHEPMDALMNTLGKGEDYYYDDWNAVWSGMAKLTAATDALVARIDHVEGRRTNATSWYATGVALVVMLLVAALGEFLIARHDRRVRRYRDDHTEYLRRVVDADSTPEAKRLLEERLLEVLPGVRSVTVADERPVDAPDAEAREITLRGESYGWVTVECDRPLTDEAHRRFDEAIAATVPILETLRVLDRVESLARTDALTDLANRRQIDDTLASLVAHAQRTGQELGVIAIDIDHFKTINDEHGHQAGDKALVALADVLRSRARAADVVGRWGGEEFVVLCPGTDLAGTAALAEDLRAAVDADTAGPVRMTISCGVATADHAGHDPAALMRSADAALYEAKRTGRNRVAIAAPMTGVVR